MNEIKILKPLNNAATPFKFVKDETHVAGEGEWEGTPYKYYWGKLYFNGNLIDDQTTVFFPVNPNYYMIDDSYFDSPGYDSRIEKYIHRTDDPRDFPMVHQKYVEGKYPIETIREIEIKRPSAFNIKAHDIIKKIVSIVDDNTRGIDSAAKGSVLLKIVDVLNKHRYANWLNNTANRANPIEDFLKSLTNEQLIDIIEELTKIKSTLFEIKIKSPTNFIFVPNSEKPRYGAMNIAGATTSMGKLYWANELVADRAMLQRSEEGIPTHLNFIMSNEEYDQLDPRIKDKLSKSALSTISSYALYVKNVEDVVISEKN